MAPGLPKAPPPHIVRMMQEGDRLNERAGKLAAFTASEDFKVLPPIDQELMQVQLSIMLSYLRVLRVRLARESDKHTGKALDIAPTLGSKSGIVLDS